MSIKTWLTKPSNRTGGNLNFKSELNQDELILNLLKVKCTLIELDYYNLLGRVGLIFVLLECSPTKFLKITDSKTHTYKGCFFVLFSKLLPGTNDLKESNLLPMLTNLIFVKTQSLHRTGDCNTLGSNTVSCAPKITDIYRVLIFGVIWNHSEQRPNKFLMKWKISINF